MKIMKRITGLLFLFLCIGLTVLFTCHPYLLRVLWYCTPTAQTYKIFPQAAIHKSSQPFKFIRSDKPRSDLDTLQVLNGQNKLVTWKEYLKTGRINVFLVIRNDTILYEYYAPGYTDSSFTSIFSGAKSMVSIMLGQALASGDVKSLDDKVTDYLSELKLNKAFAAVTLRHLLQMKSGLHFQDALGGVVQAFFSDEAKLYYTHDMKAELKKIRLDYPPGTVWQYKSIDPILLGWVLEKATGQTTAQYFEKYTWQKIGAEHAASWGLDHPGGLSNTASRFQATAIDLAKIGRLYLHGGKFNGQQIVPADWVRQSISIGTEKPVCVRGWQQSAQHSLWWIPQAGEKGDFAAEGMLGQRIYADPKTNTIMVQLADKGAGNYPYRKISRYLAGLPFSYPKE